LKYLPSAPEDIKMMKTATTDGGAQATNLLRISAWSTVFGHFFFESERLHVRFIMSYNNHGRSWFIMMSIIKLNRMIHRSIRRRETKIS
jgi:hypothetical protein